MFSAAGVVPLFQNCVDLHVAAAVGPQHNPNCLLACPQLDWFQDRGRRRVNNLITVVEIATKLHELRSVEKSVLLSQQEARCQKVLSGSDQGSTVLGNTDIAIDVHEDTSFSPSLLCLRHVDVHLVTVKISIVGRADTLVESQSTVLHDLCLVSHD